MFKITLTVSATALAAVTFASPVQAHMSPNGPEFNGLANNGIHQNALIDNSLTTNALSGNALAATTSSMADATGMRVIAIYLPDGKPEIAE